MAGRRQLWALEHSNSPSSAPASIFGGAGDVGRVMQTSACIALVLIVVHHLVDRWAVDTQGLWRWVTFVDGPGDVGPVAQPVSLGTANPPRDVPTG